MAEQYGLSQQEERAKANNQYDFDIVKSEIDNYLEGMALADKSKTQTPNPSYESIIKAISNSKIEPYKQVKFAINIVTQTPEEKEIIQKIEPDLKDWILTQTHYPQLRIDIVCQKIDNGLSKLSPTEKYEKLKATHPEIQKLKEFFDCQIKY